MKGEKAKMATSRSAVRRIDMVGLTDIFSIQRITEVCAQQVVARELVELGYRDVVPSKAGVEFRGRRVSDGYAANLWLRSAIRVLVLLAEGQLGTDPRGGVRGGQALYDMVYDAAPWHEIVPPGCTFSVEPRLWSCTDIFSTRLVWSRVKDAVCDNIRRYGREKPLPPARGQVADVPVYVSCYRDHVRVFRDMSGTSLHRRGYRDVMHRAALNEAAAAGVLTLSGWKEAVDDAGGNGEGLILADPMCGSGTILIEAALMARDIAPGFMRSLLLDDAPPTPSAAAVGVGLGGGGPGRGVGRRHAALAPAAWPFQRWGDYDSRVWSEAVETARDRVRPPWRGRLLGVDVHEGALSLAVRQAKKAGVYNMLELTHGDCGTVVPAATPHLEAFLAAAWRSLDGFLYRQCPGASATVLSGNASTYRYLKLRPQSKNRLVLSGVEVQVASYKIRDSASRNVPSSSAAELSTTVATAEDARPS
ncbi:hypothetical protein VOLCADRAFT_115653, partial [Volvox carteri f. nagariensis]